MTWDGRDAKGADAASGVYYARLAADRYGAVHRMLLLEQGAADWEGGGIS